jgi:hypothetical protein
MNLHHKVAGVPAWGWGIAIVGGLVLGIYLRRKSKTASLATAGVPFATVPNLSEFGGATGGGGPSGVAPAPSGLDPGLEELLGSSMSELVNSESILAQLADSSTRGALGLAQTTTAGAFQLASSAMAFTAQPAPAPIIIQMPSSGGSGSGNPQSAPPVAPPAPAEHGITTTEVPGLSSGGAEMLLRSFGG